MMPLRCGVQADLPATAEVSDEALVASARMGCDDSLTALFVRYRPVIAKKAVACGHPFLDQDDLVQEGMLALLRAVRFYRSDREASFFTFALTCINNSIRSALRSGEQIKHRPMRDYISLDENSTGETAALRVLAQQDGSPEDLVIKMEEYALIRQKIRSLLSGLEREILMLYLKGSTYEQVAAQMGVTEKSVDNALQRARKKLGAAMR